LGRDRDIWRRESSEMRASAFGARGDLGRSGAAFYARGEMVFGSGAFCAGEFLVEIRAKLSIS